MPQQTQPEQKTYAPAFNWSRFKGTYNVSMNAQMAEELFNLLDGHDELPPPLFSFRDRIAKSLDERDEALSRPS